MLSQSFVVAHPPHLIDTFSASTYGVFGHEFVPQLTFLSFQLGVK